MSPDRVTLTVPARGEYARTVRMTASALATRLGMTFEEVEEVRMAAEEAFVYASDTLPEGADIAFVFGMQADALTIDVALGTGHVEASEDAEDSASYAAFILDAVCDSVEFVSDETGAHLRLAKAAGGVDAG
jgi:serine/threonine-protein kinase RsbW